MPTKTRSIALLATLCLVSACGGRTASGPGPVASEQAANTAAPAAVAAQSEPATTVKGKTPVQLYSVMARQVRACWFNPAKPLLRKYVFRGEAGAGGRSGVATNIEIHEQTPDQKRGLKAFSILFEPLRDGTRVVATNLKLPEAQGQQFISSVSYWAQGGSGCSPGVAPTPR